MSRILYSIQLKYLTFRSCILCVYAHCNQAWLIIKFVLLLAKQVFSSLDSFIPLLFYTHTHSLTHTPTVIQHQILLSVSWIGCFHSKFHFIQILRIQRMSNNFFRSWMYVCVFFFLVLVLQTVFAFDKKLRLDSIWFFRLLLFLSMFFFSSARL